MTTFYHQVERSRKKRSITLALLTGAVYVVGLVILAGNDSMWIYAMFGFLVCFWVFQNAQPTIRTVSVSETELCVELKNVRFHEGFALFSWPGSEPGTLSECIELDFILQIRQLDLSRLEWYPRRWWSHTHACLVYPLNGSDGLEITSHSGHKWYVNTDDPEGLERAIRQALEARGRQAA